MGVVPPPLLTPLLIKHGGFTKECMKEDIENVLEYMRKNDPTRGLIIVGIGGVVLAGLAFWIFAVKAGLF